MNTRITTGIWRHKLRPIQICLIVDDFGVSYILGNNMLITYPQSSKNTTISPNILKEINIDLKWYYEKRTCWSTMDGNILELRKK